jgi:hypothetical protein
VTTTEKKHRRSEAERLAGLWKAGKMIGGDSIEVSIALLEEIDRQRAERDREDRLLLADWHHSVKDGMHVWRTVLNLGVPGHWSDGSTLIEVVHADRAEASRLAAEKLDAPPPA